MSNVSQDIKDRLKKQIEFYFGDSNSKDKWLRAKLKEDAEEYLPLAVLLSFNRVKEICSDLSVLQEVCEGSDVVQLSADRSRVRRRHPWPEVDTSRARSVLARGVPVSASLDELLVFFSTFGAVNAVRFRRNEAKERLDSVFVEFGSEADAAKVVAMKQTEFAPGTIVTFDASTVGVEKEKKNSNNNKKQQQQVEKREEVPKLFEPGSVVKFKGIGTGLSKQALKEVFEQFVSVPNSVKSVDYVAGASEGLVRLENDVVASFMIAKMTGEKATVDGKHPELSVLEGQEFDEFHKKIVLLDELKSGAAANKKKKGNYQKGGKKKNDNRRGKNAHQAAE